MANFTPAVLRSLRHTIKPDYTKEEWRLATYPSMPIPNLPSPPLHVLARRRFSPQRDESGALQAVAAARLQRPLSKRGVLPSLDMRETE